MSTGRDEKPNLIGSLRQIAKQDGRYDVQAFQFLFEALNYTLALFDKDKESENEEDRHVTGQELCEGIRQFAIDQFGYMAKAVFEEWGIYATDDFGEMVYLLISNHLMARRDSDSIEDFRRAYNFSTAFEDVFAIPAGDDKRAKRKPRIQ